MSPTLQTGRYKTLEVLGCGATCRVDKACDTVIGRTVALKTFLPGFGQGCEQQFLHEAQTIGRLSHPSIAQLYDVGTDVNGSAYLVMEFVAGKTLEHLLKQALIPLHRAAVWAGDLASALACAHRAGIIHGDVKPGNILVTENQRVKLADFGVARFASQGSSGGLVLGTPAYLSPEQIEGNEQDGRSDLFSLGVVLYEMATGVKPFDGSSVGGVCAQILAAKPIAPSKCNSALPAAFDRIIARCLAKNPNDRYQSGEELARALYLLARSSAQASLRVRKPSWFKRPVQRRDLWIFASAVLLLASALSASSSLRHRQNTSAVRTPAPGSVSAPAERRVESMPLAGIKIPYNPADIAPIPQPPPTPKHRARHNPNHANTPEHAEDGASPSGR